MTADIFTLIGTYGFPIVVCIYLLWERKKRDDEQIKQISEVVKNNTEMLGRIGEIIKNCIKREVTK